MPPPTPKRPLKAPAAVAITASFRIRSRGTAAILDRPDGRPPTDPRAAAGRSAPPRRILCDVDGTLAPIVDDPAAAAVPDRTRAAARAARRRATGWSAASPGGVPSAARRIVGVDELTYAGNHGFELLAPGRRSRRLDPALGARGLGGRAGSSRASTGTDSPAAGLRLEDKGPIQALHWRGAATRRPRAAGEGGRDPGAGGGPGAALGPHGAGDPAVAGIDKGSPRAGWSRGRRREPRCSAATTAPTSTPSRRCADARAERRLEAAVCVGVASDEAPAGAPARAPTSSSTAPRAFARPAGEPSSRCCSATCCASPCCWSPALRRRSAPSTSSSPTRTATTRARSSPAAGGSSRGIGVWLGRSPRAAEAMARMLAAARTATSLPAESPGRIAFQRLWPIGAVRARRRRAGLGLAAGRRHRRRLRDPDRARLAPPRARPSRRSRSATASASTSSPPRPSSPCS